MWFSVHKHKIRILEHLSRIRNGTEEATLAEHFMEEKNDPDKVICCVLNNHAAPLYNNIDAGGKYFKNPNTFMSLET